MFGFRDAIKIIKDIIYRVKIESATDNRIRREIKNILEAVLEKNFIFISNLLHSSERGEKSSMYNYLLSHDRRSFNFENTKHTIIVKKIP